MGFKQKNGMAFMLFAFLLAACAGSSNAEPTTDINLFYTEVIATMVSSLSQTRTAAAPVQPMESPTMPLADTAVPALVPSSTPTVTNTPNYTFYFVTSTSTWTATAGPSSTPRPTSTINPAALAFGCNNLIFIRDVTIPSGAVVQPQENFTKTWKVMNNGTCKWMYHYQLMILSTNGVAPSGATLGRMVDAGGWAEISVNIDAPKGPGTYTSYWRLADQDGNMFGTTLTLSYKIEAPTAIPPTAIPPTSTDTPTNTVAPPTSTSTPPLPTSTSTETPTP